MATTVITQVIPTGEGSAFNIKGTVGGAAFLYRRDHAKVTIPLKYATDNKQPFVQEFADAYATFLAANTLLASATAIVTILDNQNYTVVYGGTPTVQVGYDTVEITATVNTVSTKIHMSLQEYLTYANNSALNNVDFQWLIGKRLISQAKFTVDAAVLIASFTTV